MTVPQEKQMVLPIITVEDEDYARNAFVAGMQENGLLVNPDQVRVRQKRDGDVTYLHCLAESPDHKVNPYASGAFYGDASGGKMRILEFFDPQSGWWKTPEPEKAWHTFTGSIAMEPISIQHEPIALQGQPILDVWFDATV